jgi:two-component system response regulator HydG
MTARRILVVDDDAGMCALLEDGLRRRGFSPSSCTSPDGALALLDAEDFDAVVTDLNMGGMNGLELCERVTANRPDVPVVVITAFGSMESAIGAVRLGAYDYIAKPFEIEELELSLQRAIQHRHLREEVTRLRQIVEDKGPPAGFTGRSEPMKKVFEMVDRVAASDISVLVTGESGSGKELVARALHDRSPRRGGPFVAINCAAVPEPLLESELFGHERGAFTDARSARQGLLLRANGGTLLLDEIGEMPLALQPKLLRALQERQVRPVGSDREIPFDTRIVASTNRDIEADVEERRFREDLYFRINVVHVHVPPLRARGGDILLLAQEFVSRFSSQLGKQVTGISTSAAERMLGYDWPGNVRELMNCIERAVALARFDTVTVEDLPEKVRAYRSSHALADAQDPSELVTLEELERRYILKVLKATGGNKARAARVLGLDRRTLYRKLERYGVPID